ncbi:RtcB family protein [Viridibacillus sp. YIM B01967]|uniref:3'-phosphate/5'-hydroxy nucleic acid ligase n=1 Tax=Viridibacillus soli TaxID=2798301 RepID=A0ABS1H915_9BACL|nr:RtcB family protein [Viridibacillus soli]MBK3495898.1 RtcB family protein [Viridibacillus soli]
MIEVKGMHTNAKIFSHIQQDKAVEQVQELCDQPFLHDAKIRIMPDYHAGKGCVIGTTIALKDKVVPNLVGVDVGCGVHVTKLAPIDIDFQKLDDTVKKYVPSGTNLHDNDSIRYVTDDFPKAQQFVAAHILNDERSKHSLGTLGGGNHFIEVSQDEDGYLYLCIHTGSRSVGAKIATYYQKLAYEQIQSRDVTGIVDVLKAQGRFQEIQSAIKQYKTKNPVIPKDLAYVQGEDFQNYIHDMKLAQQFAKENRRQIARSIIEHLDYEKHIVEEFDSIHNYIDTDNMILRKGAISAQKGEQLIIPINMRDGSIIAYGKGNEDWNYSAPHGAGRIMSRTQANKNLNLEDYQKTMAGIWTSSVNKETLDEAPMAYKSMEEILGNVQNTVEIKAIIKPVYNFKASDNEWSYSRRKKRSK